jgi:hypothetical protein
MTIHTPPLSRCCQRKPLMIGNVSAQFAPAMMRTSANGMSLHGLAARSTPKAVLFPAAADAIQSRPL